MPEGAGHACHCGFGVRATDDAAACRLGKAVEPGTLLASLQHVGYIAVSRPRKESERQSKYSAVAHVTGMAALSEASHRCATLPEHLPIQADH